MRKFIWKIRTLMDRFSSHERTAAIIRLLFALFLIGTITLRGYYWFDKVDTLTLARYDWSYSWMARFWIPFFDVIFYIPIRRLVIFAVHSYRHAIIPIAVLGGAILASSSYVKDIYELPSFKLALQYVVASVFGIWYPRLKIDDGKKMIPEGETNLIDTIGGPGFVIIYPGNVVLFESLSAPSSVKGAGRHIVSRFETIIEIVSLDDQHGFIENTAATTKDGIELVVQDVHYRYRLRTGRQSADYAKRDRSNPYRFSVQAVQDMAYNRTVLKVGLSKWDTAVMLAVDAGITDYIKEKNFDHLTSPSYDEADPRQEIAKKLMTGGIRQRLRNVGAELLWFDIGHFSVSDKLVGEPEPDDQPRGTSLSDVVAAQRVGTWGAKWAGNAEVLRSYGEAKRMAFQELGRAEGQSEMLQSIIQVLEDAEAEGAPLPGSRMRAILLSRTAQVLDALAEKERKRKQRNKLPPASRPDL